MKIKENDAVFVVPNTPSIHPNDGFWQQPIVNMLGFENWQPNKDSGVGSKYRVQKKVLQDIGFFLENQATN